MKTLLLLTILATGCGVQDPQCNPKAETCDKTPISPVITKTAFKVQGSVASAFGITVDGVDYSDIEDFYTTAVGSLSGSLGSLGLEGYTVDSFTGGLGFKDLTNNMSVFVQASGDRGYAAKTSVNSNDTFQVTFPAEASGDVYQVKAVKKIRLVASKAEVVVTVEGEENIASEIVTTKYICWNFAAADTSVDYSEVEIPVILSNFETSLTAKDCEAEKTPFAQ